MSGYTIVTRRIRHPHREEVMAQPRPLEPALGRLVREYRSGRRPFGMADHDPGDTLYDVLLQCLPRWPVNWLHVARVYRESRLRHA